MFRFEKLDVWQRAMDFVDDVYVVTRRFPGNERYGLRSQLRRSAVSIPSNIAEGSGRVSDKDFARFIEIAYGSLMEAVTQLQLAHRQSFLQPNDHDRLRKCAEELARMLSGLRKSILK